MSKINWELFILFYKQNHWRRKPPF